MCASTTFPYHRARPHCAAKTGRPLRTRGTHCTLETLSAQRQKMPQDAIDHVAIKAIQNHICHELFVPRDPELFSSFPVTNCSLPSRSQFALPSLPLQVFYPPTIPWLRLHAHRPGGNTTYTQRKCDNWQLPPLAAQSVPSTSTCSHIAAQSVPSTSTCSHIASQSVVGVVGLHAQSYVGLINQSHLYVWALPTQPSTNCHTQIPT